MAVSRAQKMWTAGFRQCRVEAIAGEWPEDSWHELSCGQGTKGERVFRWALVATGLPDEADNQQNDGVAYQRHLLVRESLTESERGVHERAFYLTRAPVDTTFEKLVDIAGCRWAVKECFGQAKQETGLDEHEVRNWEGWHRHVTLSMLAHATLAVIRTKANAGRSASKKSGKRAKRKPR